MIIFIIQYAAIKCIWIVLFCFDIVLLFILSVFNLYAINNNNNFFYTSDIDHVWFRIAAFLQNKLKFWL